jgi:hypothetical protein
LNNYFNYVYSQLSRWLQILAIPMALATGVIGYSFFKPTSTYWEIPVIMIQKVCREGLGDELKDCDAKEVLVWAGRNQSEIRILAKSKSRDILNALWANKLAKIERDKDLISARMQNASEYFIPGSEGLDRFLVLGRSSLTKAERLSSSYEITEEDVAYLDQGFWLYTAELTIIWESPEGIQDSERIDISIRWLPTRDKLRNELAQAIAAAKLEIRRAN